MVSPEIIEFLQSYYFPGNVRQLRSMVFDTILKADNGYFNLEDFKNIAAIQPAPDGVFSNDRLPTADELIMKLIDKAMKLTGNNQRKAAALIGLSQSTLSRKLRGF